MKVKLIEYLFGKDLNIDQDVVWFIQTVEENDKKHTIMWDEHNGRVVYIMDKHVPSLQMAAYKNALEAWLIKNGFKKDSSYECSFAEKVFYDYYKKESNDVTFLKIIDDYDSVYFGYNRHSIDCEQITESMLENMVKDYNNHKEPIFKVRKFF